MNSQAESHQARAPTVSTDQSRRPQFCQGRERPLAHNGEVKYKVPFPVPPYRARQIVLCQFLRSWPLVLQISPRAVLGIRVRHGHDGWAQGRTYNPGLPVQVEKLKK